MSDLLLEQNQRDSKTVWTSMLQVSLLLFWLLANFLLLTYKKTRVIWTKFAELYVLTDLKRPWSWQPDFVVPTWNRYNFFCNFFATIFSANFFFLQHNNSSCTANYTFKVPTSRSTQIIRIVTKCQYFATYLLLFATLSPEFATHKFPQKSIFPNADPSKTKRYH